MTSSDIPAYGNVSVGWKGNVILRIGQNEVYMSAVQAETLAWELIGAAKATRAHSRRGRR